MNPINRCLRTLPSPPRLLLASALALIAVTVGIVESLRGQPSKAAEGKAVSPVNPSSSALLDPWRAQADREKSPGAVKRAAATAFSILRPEVANRRRRADAATMAAEAAAAFAIVHAREIQAELRKDPAYRQLEQEVRDSLAQPQAAPSKP